MTYETNVATMALPRPSNHAHVLRMMVMCALLGTLAMTTANALAAQGRGNGRGKENRSRGDQGIPPGHLPSAGQCRVWLDNVPPGQQSPPTSCAIARETVARSGGRVIYGDATRRGNGVRDEDRRRECDEKDRRKGECGDDRRREDGRFPEREGDRYPDRTYPRALPEMIWGVRFGRGETSSEVRQWVGENPVRATFIDADRNGRPEEVSWNDDDGRIVQRWLDENRDGRADRVSLYQNGKVVRVILPR